MGEVKTIFVWRLDRISRKLLEGLNTLAQWCEKGVRVVSINQQLDLTGTVGRMIASVLFGVAEMEQEARRERQAVGIQAARERGVFKDNGRRRVGFRKADRDHVTQLLAYGVPPTRIAETLGIA